MFTVKWIASNGAQMLYQARDVSYTPADTMQPGQIMSLSPGQHPPLQPLVARDVSRAAVSFYVLGAGEQKTDVHCIIDNGRVYVMNASGKTVADYILATEEFPHGLAPKQSA